MDFPELPNVLAMWNEVQNYDYKDERCQINQESILNCDKELLQKKKTNHNQQTKQTKKQKPQNVKRSSKLIHRNIGIKQPLKVNVLISKLPNGTCQTKWYFSNTAFRKCA